MNQESIILHQLFNKCNKLINIYSIKNPSSLKYSIIHQNLIRHQFHPTYNKTISHSMHESSTLSIKINDDTAIATRSYNSYCTRRKPIPEAARGLSPGFSIIVSQLANRICCIGLTVRAGEFGVALLSLAVRSLERNWRGCRFNGQRKRNKVKGDKLNDDDLFQRCSSLRIEDFECLKDGVDLYLNYFFIE